MCRNAHLKLSAGRFRVRNWFPGSTAQRADPRYPGSGHHKQHEAYLAQDDWMGGTCQELACGGRVRRRRNVVNDVGDNKNDRCRYPEPGPDEETGSDEWVEKCQTGPIGSADRIGPAIIPEEAMLEQRASVIEPTDE